MVRPALTRLPLLAGFTLIVAGLVGCDTTTAFCLPREEILLPTAQVHTKWENRVHVAPDPVNNGAPRPLLAGRLYLFGTEVKFPHYGKGKVVVELYDMTAGQPTASPQERWLFDDATLQKLRQKDVIGEGYTLLLPWGSYRPDVSRVKLHLCYQPEKGTPLYAEPTVITLQPDSPLTITEQQVLPAGYKKDAAKK